MPESPADPKVDRASECAVVFLVALRDVDRARTHDEHVANDGRQRQMEVAMHDTVDVPETADHVAMKTGKVKFARHKGLGDRKPLNDPDPIAVREPDSPARDLDNSVAGQVDAGLPIVVALNGDDGGDPFEFSEHGQVGDVAGVKDQLALIERARDATRQR